VFLTEASAGGHAPIDPEPYLPSSWVADLNRCRGAVPDGTAFAVKPELARVMIARAWTQGHRRAGWPPRLEY